LGAASVSTTIYAIGGYTGTVSNKNEAYDTVANTWSTKANMTTGREGALAVVAVGTIIYAIGGYTSTAKSALNEAYDTVANTWSSKTSMTTARYYAPGAAVGTVIYVIGGAIGGTPGTNTINEAYDTVANTWSTKTAMPGSGLDGYFIGAIGTKIYCAGGTITGTYQTTNEYYDTVANSWTTAVSLGTGRGYGGGAVVGGKLYAIGGSTAASSGAVVNTNEQYRP